MEKVIVNSKETTKKGIIAIAQELIKRAEDISNDVDFVTSITINAVLNPCEIVSFDITKNYVARYNEPTFVKGMNAKTIKIPKIDKIKDYTKENIDD